MSVVEPLANLCGGCTLNIIKGIFKHSNKLLINWANISHHLFLLFLPMFRLWISSPRIKICWEGSSKYSTLEILAGIVVDIQNRCCRTVCVLPCFVQRFVLDVPEDNSGCFWVLKCRKDQQKLVFLLPWCLFPSNTQGADREGQQGPRNKHPNGFQGHQ